METQLDDYFWMIDRLGMEDNPKNQVNKDKNTVSIAKDFANSLSNGYYFGKLIAEMHPTYIKRTRKKFTLDPNISSLKDNLQKKTKEYNWHTISRQLEKFGVSLDNEMTAEIVNKNNMEIVAELIGQLNTVDNQQGKPAAKQQLLSGVNSRKSKISAYDDGRQDGLTSAASLQDRNTDIGGGSSIDLPQGFGGKRNSQLSPIRVKDFNTPGKRNHPSINASQIGGINSVSKQQYGGQQSLVSGYGAGKKSAGLLNAYVEPANEIDLPESLGDAKSSYQFMVASLAFAFEVQASQAAKMMTNNNKSLYTLCVNGNTGSDFQKVATWYQSMFPHCDTLIRLLDLEQHQEPEDGEPRTAGKKKRLQKTFHVLKGGFYSKNRDVVMTCGILFTRLGHSLQQVDGGLPGESWDWFTKQTPTAIKNQAKRQKDALLGSGNGIGSGLVKTPVSKLGQPPRAGSSSPGKRDIPLSEKLAAFYDHTGVQAVVYAAQSDADDFMETATSLLVEYGRYNYVELFTQRLQQQLDSWTDYVEFCHNLFVTTAETRIGKETFEDSGVLSYWITASIKVAESQGEVPLNDRISSLTFVSQIWLMKCDFMSRNFPDTTISLLNVLKRASRDMRQTLVIVSLELLFRLMEQFAQERNQYAPIIYKTLTFLLVEFFWEIEVRQLMLKYFTSMFFRFRTIPISILCEPLLKQVQISQFHSTSFNVFDFEFFNVVGLHPKLSGSIAVLLVDTLSKIALSSVFYVQVALNIMQQVVARFSNQPEMFQHWKVSFRGMMTSLVNMETRTEQHRRIVAKEQNSYFDKLSLQQQRRGGKRNSSADGIDEGGARLSEAELYTLKVNEKLIVYQLNNLIVMGNQLMNEELQNQLIDTYFVIEQNLSIQSKPILFVLKEFGGNIKQMLKDRQQQVNAQMREHGRGGRGGGLSPRTDKLGNPFDESQKNTSSRALVMSPGVKRRSIADLPPQVYKEASIIFDGTQPILQEEMGQNPIAAVTVDREPLGGNIQKAPPQMYDYEYWEEPGQLELYQNFVKAHLKVYKELFSRYSNLAGNNKANGVIKSVATFDEAAKVNNSITLISLTKLLRDYGIDNGKTPKALKDNVLILMKVINSHYLGQKAGGDISTISFTAFQNFLVQYAYYIYYSPNGRQAIVPKDVTAYQLVERLFNDMKANAQAKGDPHINSVFKLETKVVRKTDDFLELLTQKVVDDDRYRLPDGYKKTLVKKQEVVYTVNEKVADVFHIHENEIVCIEVLDGIIFNLLGSHFLEPTTISNMVPQVVPSVKAKVREDTQIRRNTLAKQRVTEAAKPRALDKGGIGNTLKPGQEEGLGLLNSASAGNLLDRSRFEKGHVRFATALPRNLSAAMKVTILEAPVEEQRHLTEVALTLEHMVTNVAAGTSKFAQQRIQNYNRSPHQRLFELAAENKKKLQEKVALKNAEPEEDPELVAAQKQLNAIKYADLKVRLQEEADRRKEEREIEKEEAIKKKEKDQKRADRKNQAYLEEQALIKEDAKAFREEREHAKAQEQQKARQDKLARRDEANDLIHERNEIVAKELRTKTISKRQQDKLDEQNSKRDLAAEKRKKDSQFNELQDKVDRKHAIKEKRMGEFGEFLTTAPVKSLLREYEKGLVLSYSQVCRQDNRQSGITPAAWTKYANNTILTKNIMPLADAKSVFDAALRQRRSPDDNWMPEVVKTPNGAISNPGENEIGYPSFVGCLVSLAIVGRNNLKGQQALIPPSKTSAAPKTEMAGYNREFDVKKIQPQTLRTLFEAINVQGGIMSKPKVAEKVKPPLAPVKHTNEYPDYLHDEDVKKAAASPVPKAKGKSVSQTRGGGAGGGNSGSSGANPYTSRSPALKQPSKAQAAPARQGQSKQSPTPTSKGALSPTKSLSKQVTGNASSPNLQRQGTLQQSPSRQGTVINRQGTQSPSPIKRQGTIQQQSTVARQGSLSKQSPSKK